MNVPRGLGLAGVVIVVAVSAVTMLRPGGDPQGKISAPGPAGEIEGCFEDVCPADPNHPDSAYLREVYGFTALTYDGPGEHALGIDGNLVVWEWFRKVDGENADDILAYNLSSGRLVPIGVGREFFQILPFLDGGRVLFFEQPNRFAPGGVTVGYMVLWDAQTGARMLLDAGLGGEAQPSGFDGSWVVFKQRGSKVKSDDGLWVLNVDNGTKHLVHPATPSPAGDAYGPVLTGEAIAEGRVYYAVSYENQTGRPRNSTLYEFDLGSLRHRQLWMYPEAGEFWIRDADGDRVVWDWPRAPFVTEVWAWDGRTNTAFQVSRPDDKVPGFPRIGGDWVVYAEGGIRGFHVPTRTHALLVPDTHEILSQRSDTDGDRLVVSAFRRSPDAFENLWDDLYWKELPKVEGN